MKINSKHILTGKEITLISCEKNKMPFSKGALDTIIIHFTEGRNGLSSAKYLAKDNVKASSHVVIDRNSKTIYQLVPFDVIAWHAGVSIFKGKRMMNNYSIGIELDNAGKLDENGKTWFDLQIPEEDIYIDENGDKWHKYTEDQISLTKDLCKMLIEKYNIKLILGHSEIASNRKVDPGPAFPIDEFRELLNIEKE